MTTTLQTSTNDATVADKELFDAIHRIETAFPGAQKALVQKQQRSKAIVKARQVRPLVSPKEQVMVVLSSRAGESFTPTPGEIQRMRHPYRVLALVLRQAGFEHVSWGRGPADAQLARGLVVAVGDALIDLYPGLATGPSASRNTAGLLTPARYGQMFLWNGEQIVMAVPDRGTIEGSKTVLRKTADDLKKLWTVSTGELNPVWELGMRCVVCGGRSEMFGGQGFGWCSGHKGIVTKAMTEDAKIVREREVAAHKGGLVSAQYELGES